MASFEWFVSLRYLRAKRKQKFISLITVISILGVAVGVLAGGVHLPGVTNDITGLPFVATVALSLVLFELGYRINLTT